MPQDSSQNNKSEVLHVPSRFVEVERPGGILVQSTTTGKLYRDTEADYERHRTGTQPRR